MPGGDGTGPRGMGPMTGRSAGYCAGYDRPGFMHPGMGRDRGFGRGFRFRGGGRWAPPGPPWAAVANWAPPYAYAAPTQDEEIAELKAQAEYLAQTLEQTQKRLADLEADTTK